MHRYIHRRFSGHASHESGVSPQADREGSAMGRAGRDKFRLSRRHGVELEGAFTPWIRFCIGLAILLSAATPLAAIVFWLLASA